MKELVVISGKGGTGKTSITASFAALAKNKIMVDCDVDAADMHLLLKPEIEIKNDFYGGMPMAPFSTQVFKSLKRVATL